MEKLNTEGKLVWEAKIVNHPISGWLYRNQSCKIMDCREISEEYEIYQYLVEIEYQGEKYRTWIDAEYIEI